VRSTAVSDGSLASVIVRRFTVAPSLPRPAHRPGAAATAARRHVVALGIPLILTFLTLIDIAVGKHTSKHE
jgi:hypothetical protein